MIRKGKKTQKYRGSRTCGGGCHKKRRGFGSRGGKGLAGGRTKAKWDMIQQTLPGHLGKRGFVMPPEVRRDSRTINIGYISQTLPLLLTQKLATEKEGTYSIDVATLGAEKVLGAGKVTQQLIVTAKSFSEKAKQKIERAGGEARGSS
jgi:large subunit ribosomal protein L15